MSSEKQLSTVFQAELNNLWADKWKQANETKHVQQRKKKHYGYKF